jgi:CBS domain-containing protein
MTSNPQGVSPVMTVRSAAEVMEREDVGSLPVVDDNGMLVGIVTDRDIVVRVVAAGHDVDKVRVREIVSERPVPVRLDDELEDVRTDGELEASLLVLGLLGDVEAISRQEPASN